MSTRQASANELEIRPATEDDTPAILDLVRVALGEGPRRTAAYWEWKHVHNPFGESPTLLALDEERVVGLRTFMRWRWQAGTRTVDTVRAVDTAVHPDYRRKGLFSRLTLGLIKQVETDGTAFVFNTPNRISLAGYRRLGWNAPSRAPVMLKVRPSSLLGLLASVSRRPSASPDLESSTLAAEFPAVRLSELATRVRPRDSRLRTPVDEHFLNWRYRDIPGLQYDVLGEGEARAIARRGVRRGTSELLLCHLLCPNEAASDLIRLLRGLRRQPVGLVTAIASPGTRERRQLWRAGFLPAWFVAPRLVTRPLAEPSCIPSSFRGWALTLGDLELF